VHLIDALAGRIVRELVRQAAPGEEGRAVYGRVRFAPDGRTLTGWEPGGPISIWSTETGEARRSSLEELALAEDAAYSRDGRFFAACFAEEARVWDYETGRSASPPLRHPSIVDAVELSADGQLLATTCGDRGVRFWDWRRGELVCPPLEHEREIVGAGFLPPDGRYGFSASRDWLVRLWDLETGKPLIVPRPFFGEIAYPSRCAARPTPDGRTIVVNSSFETRVVRLAELEARRGPGLDAAGFERLGAILAAQTIHAGGGTVNLPAEEWLTAWLSFRKDHPELLRLDRSPAATAEWHRLRARQLEEATEHDAALWHLGRLGPAASPADSARAARIRSTVRDWRFSGIVEDWPAGDDRLPVRVAVPLAPGRLEAIAASASSAPLVHSRGPFIDFGRWLPARTDNVAGYALRTIVAERDMEVRILTGSDDSVRLWLNGKPILEKVVFRGAFADSEVTGARLAAGRNDLLVEVSNGGGGWGLFLRLEDAAGRRLALDEEGRITVLGAER
jgi:hypothetical protein